METTEDLIIFFVKYPESGRVKTRLSQRLGPDLAASFYRNFVLDLLETFEKVGRPLAICFSPQNKKSDFVQWLGPGHPYRPQKGKDLGERMRDAFECVFLDGWKRAILLGSDIPDLPSQVVEEALTALHTRDTVIGPALDGGYYLIGFRHDSFSPEAFKDVPWGSGSVFTKTLAILKAEHRSVHILPAWRDVDTLEDLRELAQRSTQTGFAGSRTMAQVAELLPKGPEQKGQNI